jgi:dTDP-glucose 4,6-dehydratase
MVQYVADRPGHDRRYSVRTDKVRSLGWRPEHDFRQAVVQTVEWYRGNESWWRKLKKTA